MWNDTTLESIRASAARTSGPVGEAMRRFAANPNDRRAQQSLSQNVGLSSILRTTCVATMLEGGHAENALAQSAAATVNCRIFPGVAVADVQTELQAIAGADVVVAPLGPAPSSEASPLRADVVQAITHAVEAHAPGVGITPFMSAGATDGLYFRAAGIPTYGAGAIFIRESDAFAHGLNERVPVEAFYNGLTHWRVLLREIASPARGGS
jgi:acetylornithine deacetylase/succinyl-diaminopimelate desuccinylase-like protein